MFYLIRGGVRTYNIYLKPQVNHLFGSHYLTKDVSRVPQLRKVTHSLTADITE